MSEKLGVRTSYKCIIQAASRGSTLEREVLTEALDYLCEDLMDTIYIFDPHKLALGGQYLLDMASGIPDLFNRFVENVSERTETEVCVTKNGSYAVSLGAASLVLQTVYDHTSFVR